MKKAVKFTIKIIFITILLLITTCKQDELVKITKLEIGSESAVTETTATVAATFIDVSTVVTAFGHCYATSSMPGISDSKTTVSGSAQKGEYSSHLTALSPNTKYFVRAYAMDGDKAVYSSGEISFTTGAYQLPILTTDAISEIIHNSAVSGGEITDDGGQEISERGVCWSSSKNPTIDNDKTVDGTGIGTFISSLTGLNAETTYYVRAYARNSVGTAYGNLQNFTTLPTPFITVISPTTGDHWLGLESVNISWSSNNLIGNVGISLFKGDSYVTDIISNTSNDDFYSWTSIINGQYDTDYKVRITSLENVEIYAESNTFKISEASGATGSISGYSYTYNAIKIGYQWWMAENLQEPYYPDGTYIPRIFDSNGNSSSNDEWYNLGNTNTNDAGCYYDNTYNNLNTYGMIYNYAAAIADNWSHDNKGGQGICPNGWHLPTDVEWKELEIYLGIGQAGADALGFRGSNQGSELSENTALWFDGNLDANSEFGLSGFATLPGGSRSLTESYDYGSFHSMGESTGFWTATEYSDIYAWYRGLYYYNSGINRYYTYKVNGYYVRCVRD